MENHRLKAIEKEYRVIIDESLQILAELVKNYEACTYKETLEVLSYLSNVKYRFSLWDYLIDKNKVPVYVYSPRDKNSNLIADENVDDLIEGPIAIIYKDLSINNLNYFLTKGANPLEAKAWGTVSFDIGAELSNYRGIHHDLFYVMNIYDDYLLAAIDGLHIVERFDLNLFEYNLNEDQLLFLDLVEKKVIGSFNLKRDNFFKKYPIHLLEELTIDFSSKYEQSKRYFLPEFLIWNELFDNIIEISIKELYIKYEVNPLTHYLKRMEPGEFLDLFKFNSNRNSNLNIRKVDLQEFAGLYDSIIMEALKKTKNDWIIKNLGFFDEFVRP